MSGSLSYLRIVEIGQNISAPYATRLLADLGAGVVKVEQLGTGDPMRSTGSFPEDPQDSTVGSLFRYLNANKRSVEFDLVGRGDVEALLELIKDADIVIENLGPGVIEEFGLGFDQLGAVNSKISLVRISDFGQDGPCCDVPATDFTVQAASGWVSKHMAPGRNPVQVGGRIPDYVTGAHAACAALTARKIASQLDNAVSVDVSKQECLLSTLPQPALTLQTLQALGWGIPEDRVFPVPGVVLCKDGYVGINILLAQHFEDFCNLAGIPEHIPNRMSLQVVGPNLDAFYRDIKPWLMEHGAEEIVDLCQAFRIPAAPVSNGRSLPELAQLRARAFYRKDAEENLVQPGFPYKVEATGPSLRCPAPELGEHNAEIAQYPWHSERASHGTRVSREGAKNQLPFAGLRVLDLGIMWAGPYVGCYLGALGADVIKVESIQRPDPYRYASSYPEEGADWYERSSMYQGANLNKRDLTLNLNQADGRRILERLVAKADIFIENFSPRVLDNMGLSPERLRKLNPNVIILRMPGFGLDGPWRDYVGWAMSIEQASGMAWVTGEEGDVPLNPGGFVDPTISMHSLVALQAALDHRERTGEAQIIEVAQLEAGACITAEQVIAYSMTGKVQGRSGNRSEDMAPQGVYPCTNGEWVAITIRDDIDWQKFVDSMGSPEWARAERFCLPKGRQEHHDELDQLISQWSSNLDADMVVRKARTAGLPVAQVLKAENMHSDPHLRVRKFYQELPHPRTGPRKYAGWPMLYSIGPDKHHRSGASTLGQHNLEILGEELGLSSDEIAELARKEIIGTVPQGLG